ncbi:MAG: hypothetical protein JNK05_08385 [Myxococcales bacterium]|nr:hypothetical protein [Myxococcales bacterium]
MSDHSPERGELPEDIRDLLRGEQQEIAPPADARDAVLDRVFTSVGLAPAPHTTPPPPTVGAATATAAAASNTLISWVAGALVTAAALGGGAMLYRSRRVDTIAPTTVARHVEAPATAQPHAPRQQPTEAPRAAVPTVSSDASAGPLATVAAADPSSQRRRPSAPAAESPEDLAEEQQLLSAAQRALTQRDTTAALAAVRAHSRRFARGALAEERDALEIRALLLGEREQEARALAQRFRRRYPDSVFIATIEERLGRP